MFTTLVVHGDMDGWMIQSLLKRYYPDDTVQPTTLQFEYVRNTVYYRLWKTESRKDVLRARLARGPSRAAYEADEVILLELRDKQRG